MAEYDKLLERAKKQAKEHKLALNPNKQVVDSVIKGLMFSKKNFGEHYCPCKPLHVAANVCMCEEVRNGGKCVCGLFVKK